jgi:formamidopyrimidine-DNA glycosylase
MPELPEVETTRRGLLPAVLGKRIAQVHVYEPRLRWPVPPHFARELEGRTVRAIDRRGKYLIWDCEAGYLLSHLGMSGSLTAIHGTPPRSRHDHVELVFEHGIRVRFHDPRRFGAMLWIGGRAPRHPLLDKLGPEPLSPAFTGKHLHQRSRGKSVAVKNFIMDASVVVGVGNIYASESLFHAGIAPTLAAGRISLARYERLAAAIVKTLAAAIKAGGSSLRNYVGATGEPGHFQLATMCYGREGLPCRACHAPIRRLVQGQRATYYCARCQR